MLKVFSGLEAACFAKATVVETKNHLGDFESFLQVDDVEQETEFLGSSQSICQTAHVCQLDDDLLLNRFVYSFVFESEVFEAAKQYANSALLSRCPSCLSRYIRARHQTLRVCGEFFDTEGVADLVRMLQQFDKARVENNLAAYQRTLSGMEGEFDEVCFSTAVFEFWMESAEWWGEWGLLQGLVKELEAQVVEASVRLLSKHAHALMPRLIFKLFSGDGFFRRLALRILERALQGEERRHFIREGLRWRTVMTEALALALQGPAAQLSEAAQVDASDVQDFLTSIALILELELLFLSESTTRQLLATLSKFILRLVARKGGADSTASYLPTTPNNSLQDVDLAFAISRFLQVAFGKTSLYANMSNEADPKQLAECLFVNSLKLIMRNLLPLTKSRWRATPEKTALLLSQLELLYLTCTALRESRWRSELNGGDDLAEAISVVVSFCEEISGLPEEVTCLATCSMHDGFESRLVLCQELMQASEVGSNFTALTFKSVLHHCQCALLMLLETESALIGRDWHHSHLTKTQDPKKMALLMSSIKTSFQMALDVRSRAYKMTQRKQRACLDAYRELLLWALGQFSEDLGIWTFHLSLHVTLKADVRMQSASRPPATPAVVSQLAALRAPRPNIQLPLTLDTPSATPRALALVFPLDNLNAPSPSPENLSAPSPSPEKLNGPSPSAEKLNGPSPFQTGELLVDLLPKFLLLLHDKEELSELHMSSILPALVDFAGSVTFHLNLIQFATQRLKGSAWPLGAEESGACEEALTRLLGWADLVEKTTDVLYGSMVFLCRWIIERLKLWAMDGLERGSANFATKLPVTTVSFFLRPVSLKESVGSWGKLLLPTMDEQRAIGHGFQKGVFFDDGFSNCFRLLLELALSIAVSHIPGSVKRELSNVLTIVTSQTVKQYVSMPRLVNSPNALYGIIETTMETDLLKSLATTFKLCARGRPDDIVILEGLLMASDQMNTSLQVVQANFQQSPSSAAGDFVEILHTPATLGRQLFVYMRAILSTIDLMLDDWIATGLLVSSDEGYEENCSHGIWLLEFERALWDCLLNSLKFGPIFCQSTSQDKQVKEGFQLYDVYVCLLSFCARVMERASRQIDKAVSSSCLMPIANLHVSQACREGVLSDWLTRWARAAQSLALAKSSSNSEDAWLDCELGQICREACLQGYKLVKSVKTAFPTQAVALMLSRDVQTIMTGRLVSTKTEPVAPKSSPKIPNASTAETEPRPKTTKTTKSTKSSDVSMTSATTKWPTAPARPRETLLSKILPGAAARKLLAPRRFDVALEMMEQWKTQSGGPGRLATRPVEPVKTMGWKEMPSIAPKPAAKVIEPKAKEPQAPKPPQLKTLTTEEKNVAMAKAKLGVQVMLQQILEWDFANLDKYELPELQHLRDRLPLTFEDAESFRQYFRPLVLEECRCSILQERMEKKLEASLVVISSATVSANWMLTTAKSAKRKKASGQKEEGAANRDGNVTPERAIIQAAPQELELLPLRKHDLVMLVPVSSIVDYENKYEGKSLADLRSPPAEGYFMAVVEKNDPSDAKYEPADMTQCRLRFPRTLPSNQSQQDKRLGASAVVIGSGWLAYPIASLTTSVREFQSLFTAIFSPVFDFILKPSKFGIRRPKSNQPKDFEQSQMQFLRKLKAKPPPAILPDLARVCNLNESQSLAVKHALSADFGVSLLQGPPGTGKTKTLLALIAAIFAQRGYHKADADMSADRKILICAPSNAAVDEIAARILKEGVPRIGPPGEAIRPNCIRIGHPLRITREEVKAISLEQSLMNDAADIKDKKRTDMNESLDKISARLDAIEEELKAHSLTAMAANASNPAATTRINSQAYGDLQTERRHLLNTRKKLREGYHDDLKGAKTRSKDANLKRAVLFFATLSGSASDLLTGVQFEFVIVDEAAQAVELSSLIPLRHEVSKLILIGDPQQLPATVLSAVAKKFNYERSLFQRLQLCGSDVVMLTTQYRMRPEISAFPSKHFYQGRLTNDQSVIVRPPLPFHVEFASMFGPFKFFDVPSRESRHAVSQSLCNKDEAAFICQLLTILLTRYGTSNNACIKLDDVAVVTPYRQQVIEIQKMLKDRGPIFISANQQPLEVCTIDSFQGREKRVIVFSCVRSLADAVAEMGDETPFDNDDEDLNFVFGGGLSRPKKEETHSMTDKSRSGPSIGFVADIRRLNVAITRARDALWIVGNSRTLQHQETWRALIDHAKRPSKGPTSVPSVDAFDDSFFLDVAQVTEELRRDPKLMQDERMAPRRFNGPQNLSLFFSLMEKRQERVVRERPKVDITVAPASRGVKRAASEVFSQPAASPATIKLAPPKNKCARPQLPVRPTMPPERPRVQMKPVPTSHQGNPFIPPVRQVSENNGARQKNENNASSSAGARQQKPRRAVKVQQAEPTAIHFNSHHQPGEMHFMHYGNSHQPPPGMMMPPAGMMMPMQQQQYVPPMQQQHRDPFEGYGPPPSAQFRVAPFDISFNQAPSFRPPVPWNADTRPIVHSSSAHEPWYS